jgi:abnormal spindle-like microcephaly-associated protein
MDIYDDTLAIDIAAGAADDAMDRGKAQSRFNTQEEALCYTANTRKRRSLAGLSLGVEDLRGPENTTDLNDLQHLKQEPPRSRATTGKTEEVKKARRRTIYIPSEDTSILTIHPGASLRAQARRPKAQRKSDVFLDLAALSEEEESASYQASPRSQAKSLHSQKALKVAPKRLPFGSSQRAGQLNRVIYDVAGSGAGKENRPPGWVDGSAKKGLEAKLLSEKTGSSTAKLSSPSPKPWVSGRSVIVKPTPMRTSMNVVTCSISSPASSAPASPRVTSIKRPSPRPVVPRAITRPTADSRDVAISSPKQSASQAPLNEWSTSRSSVVPRAAKLVDQYPVLRENIANTSLYTPDHLTSQELCLSQLINDIFRGAGHSNHVRQSYTTLRRELIRIHNTEDTVQLAQRLQASLRFGGLSISKDSLAKVSRIKDDLALRQDFLNLWTKTYDLELLQAASEVVVGREMCRSSPLSGSPRASSMKSSDGRAKSIQLFLRIFLLRNEDVAKPNVSPKAPHWSTTSHQSDDDINTPAWLWRRTVVRSLLLLRLLDQYRVDSSHSFRLFQPTSSHKSSSSLLQALASMLVPFVGDVTRTLGHLNYAVKHIQFPLSEYTYEVKNLAIDLRDGVMLTRLLEVLFYASSSNSNNSSTSNLDTTTLLLPPQPPTSQSFPLSTHLHYPAPTRTHKLHNARLVMIALLTQAPHHPFLRDQLVNLEPEDLVDGYREKTIALLWTLVLSAGGLDRIIDTEVLRSEMGRIQQKCHSRDIDMPASPTSLQGVGETGALLSEWATYTAALANVEITNLTTSFAHGQAWTAIVQAYQGRDDSVSSVLKKNGYDKHFIALYEAGEIKTKKTNLGLLAVLAACLMAS